MLLIFSSCNETGSQTSSHSTNIPSIEHDPDKLQPKCELSYDIFNSILPELIPSQSSNSDTEKTLFVYDKYISIDSTLVQELISMGIDDSKVYPICFPASPSVTFSPKAINDCEYFEICRTIPVTTSELENNIGTITFSELILTPERDHASFLYSFHKTFDRRNSTLSHVQLSVKNGTWVIDSMLSLKRNNFRIIEN